MASLLKGNPQAGGKEQIVIDPARYGIAQVTVTQGELPGQPFLQRGDHADIEVDAVLAGAGQVVKHSERLLDRRRGRHLVRPVVTPESFARVPHQTGSEVLIVV